MAEGGIELFPEERPDDRENDDDDDDDRYNRGSKKTPYVPIPPSSPGEFEMKTFGGKKRGNTSKTSEESSFIENLPDTPDKSFSTTQEAKRRLEKEFPNADFNKLKYRIKTSNDRLEVGLFSTEKKFYPLTTKILVSGETRINKELPKEVLKVLGKSRRQTLEEELTKVNKAIRGLKEIAEKPQQDAEKREKSLRKRAEENEKRRNLETSCSF